MNIETKIPTVQELRKASYRVSVIKKRFYTQFDTVKRKLNKQLLTKFEASNKLSFDDYRYGILAKGGLTKIVITSPDQKEFSSEAVCSKHDTFNSKRAIRICMGRIIRFYNFQVKFH